MSMSELEVLAHIDRGMLYSFVWSIPPEVLAERMHVSVDAIQRSCANRGIPPDTKDESRNLLEPGDLRHDGREVPPAHPRPAPLEPAVVPVARVQRGGVRGLRLRDLADVAQADVRPADELREQVGELVAPPVGVLPPVLVEVLLNPRRGDAVAGPLELGLEVRYAVVHGGERRPRVAVGGRRPRAGPSPPARACPWEGVCSAAREPLLVTERCPRPD